MAERDGPETRAVDLAMNQVLAAEQEAREAVTACGEEARKILAQAEELARGISRRTERRVKAAHRIADQAVERALGDLSDWGSDAGDPGALDAGEERLERALDRLVDEIVGGAE